MSKSSPVVIKLKGPDKHTIEESISRIRTIFNGAFVGKIQETPDGVIVFINASVEVVA
jgi:hypothetical protein